MENPYEDQSGRDTRRCSGPVKPVARILSARFRPTRKANSPCSRQGRSCSISPSAMRACCRTMPMRGRAITWMFAALNTGGASDP